MPPRIQWGEDFGTDRVRANPVERNGGRPSSMSFDTILFIRFASTKPVFHACQALATECGISSVAHKSGRRRGRNQSESSFRLSAAIAAPASFEPNREWVRNHMALTVSDVDDDVGGSRQAVFDRPAELAVIRNRHAPRPLS